MTAPSELNAIITSLEDLSRRITLLVEGDDLPSDAYTELVAAERSVGTLLRRLRRVTLTWR